ncbi:hypothetical protein FE394_14790 [Xenorhabdus sp. Reich]|uniref:DUF2513 domain-containing protein n=1 Tax=Xenorhabdus littoralis TaxID=2582835 RepID=A0ABU4SPD7_9GAMM|nr:hypothetical protein [Xenorhabdus sp. Reich]MDX8000429.1 hypothetical protein [Xenorhabdus sp. Reich]
MTMLKERHLMIIRAMNDQNRLMRPVSEEKLQFLGEAFGWDQLADDINYLIKIGLVNHDAIRYGIDGGYSFDSGSMTLTAAGIDYANMDTIGNEINVVTIKIHKNTLEQIETIINTANIPDAEKKALLQLMKEKGAEVVIGKCIDIVFSNAGLAATVLSELAKRTL